MTKAEIAKLQAERDMAKSLLDSAERRLQAAMTEQAKKPKTKQTNRYILKQLKKAS